MAAMIKYRKTGHDIAPTPPKAIPKTPGTLPDHQIAIYDHRGRMRGRVHAGATSATVARFTGQHGATLGKVNGRTAWISPPPKGSSHADARHAQNIRQARGSVTHMPSAPETRARPKGHV